ncbi:MAG: hypothetical protein ACM3VS_17205 [Candidatus Dadabacteria bacterium]
MVRLTDLKEGDIVHVVHDGVDREGEVLEITREENLACVDNGIQEFWYPLDEIRPVPLTGQRLIDLFGFEQEETPDGVKYKKGAFRVMIHDPGNNTNVDVWYREDHRHFNHPIYIHELQNHHLQMTKVPLERVAVD